MEISTSLSTKLRIAILVLFSAFVFRAFAQEQVNARKIMMDIREGKDISYENVTVIGNLDFTYMADKLPDLPKKSKWWGDGNTVEESIDVAISFVNCTFEGDVLAYIHEDMSEYTFIADFDKRVTFSDCEFKKDAMFKYSDFDGLTDFSGSSFLRESTFKYAEFDERADFSSTNFDDDATFKYAQFDEGASFKDAVFQESWNIKYMKARGEFDIDGLDVRDDIDSKYTKINGKSFTSFLLETRN
ncbi:Pentapeptide repeat-containing protein [Ekhidna lutea]|uniref:Pentapeptide repeat-containing protein n=1 Tax=Ekhidna lutea TaxID=447679 RepID=A0A239HU98_EKHLU|nr:pentapeptide repeat-containing protein [Ekhidna lutea]SNS83794.1 Pentapeptide repeat-containing protein [Ekhidna lutea]